MSEPIKVGDLVCVVRSCCIPTVRSSVFVVADFFDAGSTPRCRFCNATLSGELEASDRGAGRWFTYPLSWLRKIDPLTEPESTEHKEEQPA